VLHQQQKVSDLQAGAEVGGVVGVVVVVVADALRQVPGEPLLALLPQLESQIHKEVRVRKKNNPQLCETGTVSKDPSTAKIRPTQDSFLE